MYRQLSRANPISTSLICDQETSFYRQEMFAKGIEKDEKKSFRRYGLRIVNSRPLQRKYIGR